MMKFNNKMYEMVKDMNHEELYRFMEEEPGHYREYSSLWDYLHLDDKRPKHVHGRPVFAAVYDYYNIDFKGKTVMDIGPGEGGSLDEAAARGAKECHFIDRDAIITRWCEIKGHTKHFWDYRCKDGMERSLAMKEKYDIVIAKGSFNADGWNRKEFNIDPDNVAEWVTKISKGHAIVTPTWDMGEEVDGLYYCCYGEHLERYLESPFHMGFVNRGYKVDCIDGYNEPQLRFPITYYK